MKKNYLTILAIGFFLFGKAGISNATTLLSTEINMDNEFAVYISEHPDEAGILFGTGDNWQEQGNFGTELQEGTDYYLHVYGQNDPGWWGGFLGEFSLTGSDHYFEANDLNVLQTNTVGWQGSLDGWGINITELVSMGENYEENHWGGGGNRNYHN